MRRLSLATAMVAPTSGCSFIEGSGLIDTLTRKAFGDNYGPVFTGETRGEYRDRQEMQPAGFRNDDSTIDPP